MRHAKRLAVALAILLCAARGRAVAQQSVNQPVYVRGDSGWVGLFGHGPEYARFDVPGANAQLQDATHVIIQPGLGLMLSFVDKAQLSGSDLLQAHARWEADYWREHAAKVDTVTRADLSQGREDVRVTLLSLENGAGEKAGIFLIGQRTADGVFVYSFSPASDAPVEMIRRFVQSLRIVRHPLTPREVKRIALALRK